MSAAGHRDAPALATGDDAALLGAIAAQRVEAIEEAYDRHAAALYRLALVVARDQGMAEDAVLGAFTELWRTCGTLDVQGSSLRAALAEGVYARCRPRRAEVRARSDRERRRPSETAFARLPRSQRELVVLIVLGEQDLCRAARCTGHSEAAAARLLTAALHAQREERTPARPSPAPLPAEHRRAMLRDHR